MKPNILNTPEKIYDCGEENNWKRLKQKHFEILSKDKSLAQMAVADMQDKGIVIPDILKKFRRYSMSFKETVVAKIAKEQKMKQQINRVANLKKKATDEDIDVKLKLQKNKPAGLDTSSPKSLPESIRPMMSDLKDKITTLKETETKLANTKAELDAKYQEAKDESKIVEKQAEIENLTQNIGKLLFAAKNETFQFQDNLVALTHQVKTVPAKATDKWKFEKVFAKLKELMGNDNAQKFLDNTLNGLQSQATEKVITELNIFSPTQKQQKQSDTSDTNKFIDALKEIYVNLRNYYLDVKKANNIVEEELLAGATAGRKYTLSKKAKMHKKAEYKAEEDVLFEMLQDFEICTPEEISLCQAGWGKNIETAETMLYVRTGLRSIEQLKDDLISSGIDEETVNSYVVGDSEDTEIESEKKVNLKKAKVNKKATVSLEMEIDDYIELLKNEYETSPVDWKTRGSKLLMNEFYEYMETFDGGKVEQPSIVMDNFLINGSFCERATDFTADGEWSNKFEEYNGNWEEFCENEAVIYNDEVACTNLGF